MTRTKMPYLAALVVTIAALLLSTWGTGVSSAQDEGPEPTTTTLPDSGDQGEECTGVDRLLDLCLEDGTRCTASRIAVEVLMSGLGGYPAGPCMQSPWALLRLIANGFGPIGTST